VLQEFNFGETWQSLSVQNDWTSVVHAAVQAKELADQRIAVLSTPSLRLFGLLGQEYPAGPHGFLLDRSNPRGTLLKACLRYGTLWTLESWTGLRLLSRLLKRWLLAGSARVVSGRTLSICCWSAQHLFLRERIYSKRVT
jgi:hypothetical protein